MNTLKTTMALNEENLIYERQIEETNRYGNSLLSGLITEKITENRRKLSSRIHIKEEINNYNREIEKLKKLKIGNIHHVFSIKEENDSTQQIKAAEQLLMKIEQILNDYVCQNAENVITKEEFKELKNNLSILESLKANLTEIPNTSESKLKQINDFKKNLNDVVGKIDLLCSVINESHQNIIKYSSDSINYM